MQDANLERYLGGRQDCRQPRRDRRRSAGVLRRSRQDRLRTLRHHAHQEHLRHAGFPDRLGRGRLSVRPGKVRQGLLRCLALSASRRVRRAHCHAERSGDARGNQSPLCPACLVGGESAVAGLPHLGNGGALAQTAGSRRFRSRGHRGGGAHRLRRASEVPHHLAQLAVRPGRHGGGRAGDESPLVFNDKSLKAEPTHHFNYNRGGRGGPGGRGARRAAAAREDLPQCRVAESQCRRKAGDPLAQSHRGIPQARRPGRGQSAGGQITVVAAGSGRPIPPTVQPTGRARLRADRARACPCGPR